MPHLVVQALDVPEGDGRDKAALCKVPNVGTWCDARQVACWWGCCVAVKTLAQVYEPIALAHVFVEDKDERSRKLSNEDPGPKEARPRARSVWSVGMQNSSLLSAKKLVNKATHFLLVSSLWR